MKIFFTVILFLLLFSCNTSVDTNNLGTVTKLPPGEYLIWNTGSRHIVKCLKTNKEYYYLNDVHFKINGIPGYDAHQYTDITKIIIK